MLYQLSNNEFYSAQKSVGNSDGCNVAVSGGKRKPHSKPTTEGALKSEHVLEVKTK